MFAAEELNPIKKKADILELENWDFYLPGVFNVFKD